MLCFTKPLPFCKASKLSLLSMTETAGFTSILLLYLIQSLRIIIIYPFFCFDSRVKMCYLRND